MRWVNVGSRSVLMNDISRIARRLPPATVPLVAMAILAVFGWFRIADKSLTLDEIATLRYARQPIGDLLDTIVEGQANMALYYLAMVPWIAVSDAEAWLRIPSLAAAILTIPALYRVGSRTVGVWAAGIAVLLYASSATVVQYAQNARSYTLVGLAAVLATWAFLRARERPTALNLLAYVLVVAGSGYLHFFAGFVVLAHLVVLVVDRDRSAWPRWVIAYGLVAILVAPLIVFTATQDSGQIDWINPVTLGRTVNVLIILAGGIVPVAIFVLGGIGLGLLAWRRDPTVGLTIVAVWAIAPILATIAISLLKPLLVPRYLIVALPGIFLLVGAGIALLPIRARIGLLAIGLFVSGLGVAAWYRRPEPMWREATQYILEGSGPTDAVLYDVSYSRPAAEYYADAFDAVDRLPPAIGYADLDGQRGKPLWVVVHLRDEEERLALGRRLSGDWELSLSRGFSGISVRLYLPLPAR